MQANGAGERVSGAGEVVNGRDASTNGESRTNGGSANGLSHKRRRGSSALSDDHEDEPGPAAPPPSKKHKPDVRVPQTVITAGVKVVREVLEGLVDVLDVDGGGEGR